MFSWRLNGELMVFLFRPGVKTSQSQSENSSRFSWGWFKSLGLPRFGGCVSYGPVLGS